MKASLSLYDTLSQLMLGYVWVWALVALSIIDESLLSSDKGLMTIPIAFILGYFINAISSWGEWILFWTWRGKPSRRLIAGEAPPKFQIPTILNIQSSLKDELKLSGAFKDLTNTELDQAFNYTNSFANQGTNRIGEFNAAYAFSRGLVFAFLGAWLTFFSFSFCLDITPSWISNYSYHLLWVGILIAWYRTKERGYYLSRELIYNYAKVKVSQR